MSDYLDFPGVDLRLLEGRSVAAAATDEALHRRTYDGDLIPIGCACGVEFPGPDRYAQADHHRRAVVVAATVRALSEPCDCTWSREERTSTCQTCFGSGRTLMPLPAMQFRDPEGVVWVVERLLDDQRAFVRLAHA